MGTVVSSTYAIDFTDESIKDVREELRMRQEIQKEIAARMDQRVESLSKQLETLSFQLGDLFRNFCEDVHDLTYESYHAGRADMYEYVASSIPQLLNLIVLRLFRTLRVPRSKKELKSAIKFAAFEILTSETSKGRSKSDISKGFGHDRAFWTRVSKSEHAQGYRSFLKTVSSADRESKNQDLEQGVRVHHKRASDGVVTMTIETEGLDRFTSKDLARLEKLAEQSQDWKIAKRIQSEIGSAKAIEFLRMGGVSEKSIEKFKSEVDSME